jgi:hypothetical protein
MDKHVKVKIKEIINIPNVQFVEINRDRYWAADDEGNVFFYGKNSSPVCNSNKNIIEKIVSRDSNSFTKVIFLEAVYTPIIPTDWETYITSDYSQTLL